MNTKSYLMPFEEVVKMLIKKRLGGQIPELMKLRSMPAIYHEEYLNAPDYQECQERYHQTWWEITWEPATSSPWWWTVMG